MFFFFLSVCFINQSLAVCPMHSRCDKYLVEVIRWVYISYIYAFRAKVEYIGWT